MSIEAESPNDRMTAAIALDWSQMNMCEIRIKWGAGFLFEIPICTNKFS